ncbi:MAG: phospholipase D family protein [Deltaproteobacteria bacterium]|nr:phospholipase D family protein [Deltaproteobacteria bacterium]
MSFFKEQCAQSQSLRIAVAYLRKGGIEGIREPLRKFLGNRGCSCVFVVGLSNQYITRPEAVKELLSISRDFPGSLKLRYSSRSSFHPKIFLFTKPLSYTALVGSSNLTGGGTRGNLEANIAISGQSPSDRIFRDLLRLFSKIGTRPVSSKLNRNRWKEYTRDFEGASIFRRTKVRASLKPTGDLGEPGSFPDTNEPDVDQDMEDIEELSRLPPDNVVWKISPDRNARQWREWQRQTNETTNEGVIPIGWENLGNPSRLTWAQIAVHARRRRWRNLCM